MERNLNRWMGLAGVVGGISWILLQSVFGAEWGTPGTTAYSLYEFFNRLWLLPLLLMGLGFVAVDQFQRQLRPQFSKLPIIVVIVGFTAMIVGNVAEFWFFTDYPYGEMNARSYAWITFLLGMLIELVGLALLGWSNLAGWSLAKVEWDSIVIRIATRDRRLFYDSDDAPGYGGRRNHFGCADFLDKARRSHFEEFAESYLILETQ